MTSDEIIEAFENSVVNRDRRYIGGRATPNDADKRAHFRIMSRFLDELDGDLTIGEIREVLAEHMP